MRHALTITLLLLALRAGASPLADARASLAQVRRAITNRDGMLLTELLGNRFRDGNQIRWSDVDEYLRSAESVVATPIRTVSGETSVGQQQFAIIGWQENTLLAARFLKDANNRWLLASLHLDVRARTTKDRERFERHIRTLSDERLATGFFRGNRSILSQIARELEALRVTSQSPARTDSLDQLMARYRSIWHDHACSAIATVYDARVTWTDATNDLALDYTSLQRLCAKSGQRPELRLQLVDQKTTADDITVRIRNDNTNSGWSWDTTLTIVKTDGTYRIIHEEHTNHRH